MPSKIREGPLPLLMILPATIATSRPFKNSPTMASHIEGVDVGKIADEYGVYVVWAGYRSAPTEEPFNCNYYCEVLADVLEKYRVDSTKVFLFGSCSSGLSVSQLLLGASFPFTGAIFHNAVFNRKTDAINMARYYGIEDYSRWRHVTDGGVRLAEVKQGVAAGTSLFVVYDGRGSEGHGQLEDSINFVQSCRARGASVEYKGPGQLSSLWAEVFTWLLRCPSRDFSKDAGIGSIVFGEWTVGPSEYKWLMPFTVCLGSSGRPARLFRDNFVREWNEIYYGIPPSVPTAVPNYDLADVRSKSYVIFADVECQGAYHNLLESCGIVINPDSISVSGKLYRGKGLAVACALPKGAPFNGVIFAAQDWTSANWPSVNLIGNGWFSYLVWKSEGEQTNVVDARLY